VNLTSQWRQQPAAFAIRGMVKVPTGNRDDAVKERYGPRRRHRRRGGCRGGARGSPAPGARQGGRRGTMSSDGAGHAAVGVR
jgi:hypothetical protein